MPIPLQQVVIFWHHELSSVTSNSYSSPCNFSLIRSCCICSECENDNRWAWNQISAVWLQQSVIDRIYTHSQPSRSCKSLCHCNTSIHQHQTNTQEVALWNLLVKSGRVDKGVTIQVWSILHALGVVSHRLVRTWGVDWSQSRSCNSNADNLEHTARSILIHAGIPANNQ